MVRKCEICSKDRNSCSNLTFHRFPEEDERRRIWASLVGWSNICPKKAIFICSDHFDPEDFVIRANGYKCLKQGANPLPQHAVFENTSLSSDEEESGSVDVLKQVEVKEVVYHQHESLYNILLKAGCFKNGRVELEIVEEPEPFANQGEFTNGNEYIVNSENKSNNENCTMEPDVQIPSTSSTPIDTDDIVPPKSAIHFAVPHTPHNGKAQRQRMYRKRKAMERTPAEAADFAKAAAERQRRCKQRRLANSALDTGTLKSATVSVPVVVERTVTAQTSAQRQRAYRQRKAARIVSQISTPPTHTAVQPEQSTWNTKWSSSIKSSVDELKPEYIDTPEFVELTANENNTESEIKTEESYINELIQESESIDFENDPKISSVPKEKKISSHKTKNEPNEGIQCDLCGFIAKKVILFKKHVERVHPDCICKICGYFATKKVHLKQHKKWHKCRSSGFIQQLEKRTVDAHPDFKCYLCSFAGDTVSKLQKHVRDVHLKDFDSVK